MTSKKLMFSLAAAAVTGLIAGSANRASAATAPTKGEQSVSKKVALDKAGVKALADDTSKHDCKGKNDCKGKGGCKTGDEGCKGKNTCKGKGGCSTKDAK